MKLKTWLRKFFCQPNILDNQKKKEVVVIRKFLHSGTRGAICEVADDEFFCECWLSAEALISYEKKRDKHYLNLKDYLIVLEDYKVGLYEDNIVRNWVLCVDSFDSIEICTEELPYNLPHVLKDSGVYKNIKEKEKAHSKNKSYDNSSQQSHPSNSQVQIQGANQCSSYSWGDSPILYHHFQNSQHNAQQQQIYPSNSQMQIQGDNQCSLYSFIPPIPYHHFQTSQQNAQKQSLRHRGDSQTSRTSNSYLPPNVFVHPKKSSNKSLHQSMQTSSASNQFPLSQQQADLCLRTSETASNTLNQQKQQPNASLKTLNHLSSWQQQAQPQRSSQQSPFPNLTDTPLRTCTTDLHHSSKEQLSSQVNEDNQPNNNSQDMKQEETIDWDDTPMPNILTQPATDHEDGKQEEETIDWGDTPMPNILTQPTDHNNVDGVGEVKQEDSDDSDEIPLARIMQQSVQESNERRNVNVESLMRQCSELTVSIKSCDHLIPSRQQSSRMSKDKNNKQSGKYPTRGTSMIILSENIKKENSREYTTASRRKYSFRSNVRNKNHNYCKRIKLESSQHLVTSLELQQNIHITHKRNTRASQVQNTSISHKQNIGVSREQNASVSPEQNASVSPEQNTSVSYEQNTSVSDERNIGVSQEQNTSVSQEQNASVSPEQNTSVSYEQNTSVSDEQNIGVSQEQNTSVSQEQNASVSPEQNTSVSYEQNTSVSDERNIGVSQEQNTSVSHEQNTSVSQEENTSVSEKQNICVSPEQNTSVFCEQNIGVSQEQDIGISQEESSSLSPEQNSGVSHKENTGLSRKQTAVPNKVKSNDNNNYDRLSRDVARDINMHDVTNKNLGNDNVAEMTDNKTKYKNTDDMHEHLSDNSLASSVYEGEFIDLSARITNTYTRSEKTDEIIAATPEKEDQSTHCFSQSYADSTEAWFTPMSLLSNETQSIDKDSPCIANVDSNNGKHSIDKDSPCTPNVNNSNGKKIIDEISPCIANVRIDNNIQTINDLSNDDETQSFDENSPHVADVHDGIGTQDSENNSIYGTCKENTDKYEDTDTDDDSMDDKGPKIPTAFNEGFKVTCALIGVTPEEGFLKFYEEDIIENPCIHYWLKPKCFICKIRKTWLYDAAKKE